MKEKIIRNAVRCNKCGDVIESKHVHDFVSCSCGNVSVDGGKSYLKRSFVEYGTWDDLSEVIEVNEDLVKGINEVLEKITDYTFGDLFKKPFFDKMLNYKEGEWCEWHD